MLDGRRGARTRSRRGLQVEADHGRGVSLSQRPASGAARAVAARLCADLRSSSRKGRIESAKGTYDLARSHFEKDLSECLALWVAPRNARPSEARWLREFFPGRSWIAVEMLRRPDDAQHLAAMRRLGQSFGLPLVASGDVHMHVEIATCLAGHDDSDPTWLHRSPTPDITCSPMPSATCDRAKCWRSCIQPSCSRKRCELQSAVRVLAAQPASTTIPTKSSSRD